MKEIELDKSLVTIISVLGVALVCLSWLLLSPYFSRMDAAAALEVSKAHSEAVVAEAKAEAEKVRALSEAWGGSEIYLEYLRVKECGRDSRAREKE